MRVLLKFKAYVGKRLLPAKKPVDWPENVPLPEGAQILDEPELAMLEGLEPAEDESFKDLQARKKEEIIPMTLSEAGKTLTNEVTDIDLENAADKRKKT